MTFHGRLLLVFGHMWKHVTYVHDAICKGEAFRKHFLSSFSSFLSSGVSGVYDRILVISARPEDFGLPPLEDLAVFGVVNEEVGWAGER